MLTPDPMLRFAVLISLFACTASAQVSPRPAVPQFTLTIPLGAGGVPAAPRLSTEALLEMSAVALTGVGHLAASSQGLSGAYIPVVVLGWGGYIGARTLRNPGYLGNLGLTRARLGPAFRDATVIAVVSLGAMAAVGAAQGSLRADETMLPLLVLYPAWGVTQQTLVQGMLTRHLASAGLPAAGVVPLAAATFGSVHVPNWPLVGATTVMGGAFSDQYLRHQNVWPLGIYHGILGAAFYVWVLDRDPWREITGTD